MRDLPNLWASTTTSAKDRKRLLRALIADVTITSQPTGNELQIGIRWRSGAAEQHTTRRPLSHNEITRTPPQTVTLITQLAKTGHTNTEIAGELQAAGIRTGKDLPFTAHAVRHIRRTHHIRAAARPSRHRDLTVTEVGARLGVSPGVIYYWIRHGQLAAQRSDTNRLQIRLGPDIEQECRARIADSAHIPAQTKITATGGAV